MARVERIAMSTGLAGTRRNVDIPKHAKDASQDLHLKRKHSGNEELPVW